MNLLRLVMIALYFMFASQAVFAQEQQPIKEPLIHVIISDRIEKIMEHLNDLMDARGMTALQVMELRVKHLKELIKTIDELVVSANNLDEAIPGIRLDPESKVTFEAMAKKLQDQAADLKSLAEETNYAGMEPAYRHMKNTCDACHRLFRF